jgi:Calcineurin-like phosphoesterase superfamily domain
MLIAILSDTHLPRGARQLPGGCLERIAAADLLLHAGDIATAAVLDELRAIGPPVVAVHGNVDSEELRRVLPAARLLSLAGARVALVHDAGPAAGRLARLRRRFPDADARRCSATPTFRSTSARTTASRSSTPAARRTAAVSRGTRWAWRARRTGSFGSSWCRSIERRGARPERPRGRPPAPPR